jgi:predicted nucleotidyltransferase
MFIMSHKLYTLKEIEEIVKPIAEKYGVKRMSLFGSYARREATSDSDMDFRLMDGYDTWGLFKLAGFNRELEESLAVKVDVVTSDSLREDFLSNIRETEVIVYEQ